MNASTPETLCAGHGCDSRQQCQRYLAHHRGAPPNSTYTRLKVPFGGEFCDEFVGVEEQPSLQNRMTVG